MIDCKKKHTILLHAITVSEISFPEGERYPCLLQENDVIHYVDSRKRFVQIGHGAFADVYLGELRNTGSRVVIKSFRDSDLAEIMEEVRIHRFSNS